MDAIILAGGRGSKMMPLTADRPKSLLVAAGRPVIEHLLSGLCEAGAQKVTVVVGHGREALQGFLGDGSRHGLQIAYAVQERPAGPADALVRVPRRGSPDPLPVLPADGWMEPRLVRALLDGDGPAAVRATEGFDGRHGVPVVEDGCMVGLEAAAGPVPMALTGAYRLPLRLLDGMGDLQAAIQADLQRHGPWNLLDAAAHEVADLRTAEDLLDIHGRLMDRLEPRPGGGVHPSAVVEGPVAVGNGTFVGPGAIIEGPVILGEHCRIGAGVLLGPGTALRNHVRIDSGALMRACSVGSNVHVGAQSQIERAYLANGVQVGRRVLAAGDRAVVVGPDAVVGDGATLVDGVIGAQARVAPGRTVADVPDGGVAV